MDLQDAENGSAEPDEHVLDLNEPYPVVISPFHFVLLSVATFGMYTVWWQYKCWRYFKQKENSDSIPILWTLLFFILALSVVPLFNKIQGYCSSINHRVRYNSFALWAAVLVINYGPAYLKTPFQLLQGLIFIPFILPVMELNFYFTGNYNGYKDDKLNSRQIILLVLGVFFWVSTIKLILSGNFPPPTPDFLKQK